MEFFMTIYPRLLLTTRTKLRHEQQKLNQDERDETVLQPELNELGMGYELGMI
jgi:hypothetical protein